jgi:hypothetical protein
MKNVLVSAFVALVAFTSMAPIANAGSYYGDDDYGYTSHYKKHSHCYWKKVVWYDDYGYAHYKRVKICKY